MAAQAGMIAFVTCDSGPGPKYVTPFGGRERRLGPNPLCFAFPSDLAAPVVIDMATSVAAGGKIDVYRALGKTVPSGWIIDKAGNPTTDPNDYFAGGAILPLGGEQGHKGYGLSFMVETFSGLLTGLGFGIDPEGRYNDGTFIAVFNVEAFRSLAEFKQDVAGFVEYLKATPAATGFDEILYPGELKYRTVRRRRQAGIPLPDEAWATIVDLYEEYGLTLPQ